MTLAGAVGNLDNLSLRDLARGFFEWRTFKVRESVSVEGYQSYYIFDFLLSNREKATLGDQTTLGVLMKDWRRPCGVDVIIRCEAIVKDVRDVVQQGLVVANQSM
ncbi:MAG: hypothetical protein ACE5OZ_07275 [Candidatus Heimdallarchaeota archaeon]